MKNTNLITMMVETTETSEIMFFYKVLYFNFKLRNNNNTFLVNYVNTVLYTLWCWKYKYVNILTFHKVLLDNM